ncbi:MAG: hypothetical protein ACT4TC_11375 [Myxococcaceae bacterium]
MALQDSFGQPAPTPYGLDGSLSAGSGSGTFYLDDACTVASGTFRLAAGATSTTAYFLPLAAGRVELTAAYPDFLPATATLETTARVSRRVLRVGCGCGAPGGDLPWLGALMLLSRLARPRPR